MIRTRKTILGAILCVLMALCLTLGVTFAVMPKTASALGDVSTVTFTVKGWNENSASTFISEETEGKGTFGIWAKMNNYKPSIGEVKGTQTSVAGNFYIYNTDKIPGDIIGITITGKTDETNYFQNDMYAAVGDASQYDVTDCGYDRQGTLSDDGSSFSWTFEEGYSYNYFKLYSNERFIKKTVEGVEITVTYVPSTPQRTLESIYIAGEATSLKYTAGEEFDTTGLKVMGKYNDELGDSEITTGIEWTISPDPLTAGTTSVTVTATAGGKTSEPKTVTRLTVAPTISTIGDVLGTVDFPTSTDKAWVNENGKKVYNYVFDQVSCLDFERVCPSLVNDCVKNADGNYVYTPTGYTVTFVMAEDKLTQIVFESQEYSELNGTYEAPVVNVAQIGAYYSYDFSENPFDNGWITIDNDGDGYAWAQTFDGIMISESWVLSGGALNADNYLLSPVISLPANKIITLSWDEKSTDGTNCDWYEVMLAPNGTTDINDFITLFTNTAPGEWTQRSVDLSDYAGAVGIRIVFHHKDNDKYRLEIDDVEIDCGGCEEFTSLANAIDAVVDNETITLLENNTEEIEISKAIVFTIDKGTFDFDKSKITAGTGFEISSIENGTETTFTITLQKTIADVLNTADFPTSVDNAWVSADGKKVYNDEGEPLSLLQFENFCLALINECEENGDGNYVYSATDCSVTFVMEENVLTQIIFESQVYTDSVGTYKAPASTDYSQYYLVGSINGADCGFGGDYESFHEEYRFNSDGTLTVTFTEDSYVFVKSSDNNRWFLLESYQTNGNAVVIINGMDYAEKMLAPANVEITFTLVDNGDGTLTLSYAVKITNYTVVVGAGSNGSVDNAYSASVAQGTAYSVDGNKLTVGETAIIATANQGYEFDCWKIGDTVVTGNGTITADTTFTAVFKEKALTVGDILAKADGGFPTNADDAWANENGKKAYISSSSSNLKLGEYSKEISAPLSGSGNLYTTTIADITTVTVKFNLDGGKLVSIEVCDASMDPNSNGIYQAPTPVTHELTVAKVDGGTPIEGNALHDSGIDYCWEGNKLYILKSGLVVSGNTTMETITVQGDATDLTFNELYLTGNELLILDTKGNFNLILAKGSKNKITGTGESSPFNAYESVTIKGDGRLTVSHRPNEKPDYSIAIMVNGVLTIDGANVDASADDAKKGSYGIVAVDGLVLNSGDVGASGANRATADSIGVFVGEGKTITVNGGALTAKGYTSALSVAPIGKVTRASTQYTGKETVDYSAENLSIYMFLRVEKTPTIADVLNTVDFPTSEDKAWTNGNTYVYLGEFNLYLAGSPLASTSTPVLKDGNGNYYFEHNTLGNPAKVTFVMSNGIVTSIEISNLISSLSSYAGIYEAPASVSVTATDWYYDDDDYDVYLYLEDITYIFELKEKTGGLTYGTTYTYADMCPDWVCTLNKVGSPLITATDATLTVTKDDGGLIHIVASMVLDGVTYSITYDEAPFVPSGTEYTLEGTITSAKYNSTYTFYVYIATTTFNAETCTVQLVVDSESGVGSFSSDKVKVDYCVLYSSDYSIYVELIKAASDFVATQDEFGNLSVTASLYDSNGDKYTFNLKEPVTVADVLGDDFPTISMPLQDNVWVNANCATSKLYKNLSNGLTFGGNSQFDNFENILTAPLTKVENGYKFTKDSYTITFVMDGDKLVKITLAGSEYADNNGDYVAPHTHSFTGDYIEYDTTNHKWAKKCECGEYDTDNALTGVDVPTAKTGLIYNGQSQVGVGSATAYDVTNNSGTNANNYTAIATLKTGYIWADGSFSAKEIPWSIAKKEVEKPTADTTNYVYNGVKQTYKIAKSDLYTISGNVQQHAGTHSVKVTLKDSVNYKWAGGDSNSLSFSFKIDKAQNKMVLRLDSWVYGDTPNDVVCRVKFGKAELLYSEDKEQPSFNNVKPSKVGNYIVKAVVIGTPDYDEILMEYKFSINQDEKEVIIKDGDNKTVKNPYVKFVDSDKGIVPNAVLVVKVIDIDDSASIENTKNLLTDAKKIGRTEKIYGSYDAKLLLNGVEVQPDGSLTIKMLVPEELRDKEFKLYHVHNGEEIIRVNRTDIDKDGYITFVVDKLSEFVFIADKSATCAMHWLIIVLFVLGVALSLFFIFMKKDRLFFVAEDKDVYAMITAFASLCLSYLLFFFGHCTVCTVFSFISFAVFFAEIVYLFFGTYKDYKKIEKSDKGSSAKGNAVKEDIVDESIDESIDEDDLLEEVDVQQVAEKVVENNVTSLKESFAVASAKGVKDAFTKGTFADYLENKYGDNIKVCRRDVETKPAKGRTKGLPLPDTYYTKVSGKNKCFTYTYSKEGSILFLIKAPDFYADYLKEKHSLVIRSTFPKATTSWYSVAIDDSWSEKDIFKMLDDVKNLNEDICYDYTGEVSATVVKQVSATEVNNLMSDTEATKMSVKGNRIVDKSKKTMINIDTISKYFNDGETVTLDELKKRVPNFDRKATFYKVCARGILDKKLTVDADDVSIEAKKMILLTGGTVILPGNKQ